jgi:hypothetical protein
MNHDHRRIRTPHPRRPPHRQNPESRQVRLLRGFLRCRATINPEVGTSHTACEWRDILATLVLPVTLTPPTAVPMCIRQPDTIVRATRAFSRSFEVREPHSWIRSYPAEARGHESNQIRGVPRLATTHQEYSEQDPVWQTKALDHFRAHRSNAAFVAVFGPRR